MLKFSLFCEAAAANGDAEVVTAIAIKLVIWLDTR